MERASNSCPIKLSPDKLRDGRYGPVFQAIREDTGEFVTAELLEEPGDPSSALLQSLLSGLDKKQQASQGHTHVVSYLGHQRHDEKAYLLTEYLAGGTLCEFVQKNGALPQPLARSILRQVALGLRQLQEQGFAVALLDSRNVLMGHDGVVKIEAPLLDVTVCGQAFPPALLSLPEVRLGRRSMRKADVWLLGVVAAELFSGDSELAVGTLTSVASRNRQDDSQGSNWDLWVPQNVADQLDEPALDFLGRCFSV